MKNRADIESDQKVTRKEGKGEKRTTEAECAGERTADWVWMR